MQMEFDLKTYVEADCAHKAEGRSFVSLVSLLAVGVR